MAPLPQPKTPTDVYLHDIATSCRILAERTDEDEPATPSGGPVELREPVSGIDATPTVFTSKGKPPAEEQPPASGQTEPSGDSGPDLDKMSRAELDVHAKSVGVEDPESLPNKDAVKDAIRNQTSA